jgi:hypothetical protein
VGYQTIINEVLLEKAHQELIANGRSDRRPALENVHRLRVLR